MYENITVIGGGSGQSNLLRGLKKYNLNLSAVVTMADDGGGSGILREELGMLPPGDVRNCIIALSNTEPAMEALMQHRFREGSQKGQSFGNLFLAAMNEIYGDFELAVSKVSQILSVNGKVLPVTLQDIKLSAELNNGNTVYGESNISLECQRQNTAIRHLSLFPSNAEPFHEVIESIKKSDLIILGPGSLYTSIIPNLLVKNIVETIQESSAKKVYVANIMTENGETTGYNIVDHVQAIHGHCNSSIIEYIVVNKGVIPTDYLEKYKKNGQSPLYLDKSQRDFLYKRNINIIEEDFITVNNDLIVHDSPQLSESILKIGYNKENNKVIYI